MNLNELFKLGLNFEGYLKRSSALLEQFAIKIDSDNLTKEEFFMLRTAKQETMEKIGLALMRIAERV